MADLENVDLQEAPSAPAEVDTEDLQNNTEEDNSGSSVVSSPVTDRQPKPVAWSDITSDSRWKKASDAQKSQLLSSWTATVKSQASQLPGYNEDAYKKLAAFSDKERAKIDSNESTAHKAANFAYETVKGIPSFLLGAAETTVGLTLGAGAEAIKTGEEALGVEPGKTVSALATQGEQLKDALVSKTKQYEKTAQSYVPDEKGNIPNLETRDLLGNLKKYADSGKFNQDDINELSSKIQTSVANQYGEDLKDYANDPLRTLSSPENIQLLKAYQDTRDNAYLEHLKQNLTTSNAGKESQQDVNNLLGRNDQWTKAFGKEVGGILDSARAASANPLTLPGLLVPGGAGSGSILKNAGKSFVAGTALGSAQSGLENPLATPTEIAEAGLETGAVFSVLGAAHEGLSKLKQGIRNDPTAQALAPATAKAAEANVTATQAEIPTAKSLDQAQAETANAVLTKLQNKEITQEQYNSILEKVDNANSIEEVNKVAEEVGNAPITTEAITPEPVAGVDEAVNFVDENKDVLPQHSQDAYKELIAEAKTPEEVTAIKEKLDAEVKPAEEVKTETPKVEEQPVGEGTTLTAEIAKRIEAGEDVSGFAPEDLKAAKELVDAKKEAKTIDEKTTPEARVEKAKGKSQKTGEVKLRENSDEYINKVSEAEHGAEPQKVQEVNDKISTDNEKFDKRKGALEKELSGYKEVPGGENAAQDIIDAAKAKHRLNLLEGRASTPSMVLKNVTRDFIRKAEVLKKQGESQVSTETPIAETQTVGDTLAGGGNEAEANDTRKVTKETLAEVMPNLKENQQAAIKTVQEGGTAAAKDLIPALIKVRKALKAKGLDEAEVDDAVDRITKNDLEPLAAPLPSKEGPGLIETKRTLDPLDAKIEAAKSRQLIKQFKDEQVGKQFAKLLPDLQKIGINAGDIKVFDKPLTASGKVIGVLPFDNGRIELHIYPEGLEKQYKQFESSGFAEFLQNEEVRHGADLNILARNAKDLGYKSFFKYLEDVAPEVLKEFEQLESDVPGWSIAERSAQIYAPGQFTPKVNRMLELLRQIGQARTTKAMTESFVRHPYYFIKNFVKRLIEVFNQLEPSSYTRYIVENSDALLGQRPLDHKPLSPLESNINKGEVGLIGSPNPEGGYPETPLGKLTREVRETQVGTVAEKTLGERMDEVGKKMADTVTSTKNKLDKTVSSLRNNLGNWSVFKDAMVDQLNGLHKVTDYDNATNKWNTADQKRLQAIENFHGQLSAEFPKERLEAMSIFADAGGKIENVQKGLEWFNKTPERGEGETLADFKKREAIWKDAQQYKSAYEAAASLSPRELDVYNHVNQYLDQALIDGQRNNVLRQGIEDYFTHIWEREGKVSKQVSGELNSGKLQTYFRFARERKYPKFIDGIQNGEHPKTLNLADIVSVYDNAMRKAVASRGYVRDLTKADSGFKDEEGNPLPVALPGGISKVIGAEGSDPRLFVKSGGAPNPNYKVIDHPSFKGHKYIGQDTAGNPVVYESDLWVHPNYAKKIENNISNKSWLRGFALGRGALKVQAVGKANMLSFPFFHLVQEGYHVIGHLENPFAAVGKEITYEGPRETYWMEHGVQLRDVDGQQNFYQDLGPALLHRLPIAGKRIQAITDWVFKNQIPYYKLITAEATLARDTKRFANELESGKVTQDDLAYHAAQVANSAYGGLNYRLIGRSRTAQDFMKLFLLAPDFLEARAKFAGSAAKGLTGAKDARENLMAFALLGLTSWLGARVLNKLSDDDYHFDKPFSVVVGKKEYRQRTVVSDAVEALSSLIPGLNEPQGSWRFAFNRFSPIGQLGWGLAGVGNEAVHGNSEVAKEQFKKQLFDLATTPVPLGLKGPLLAEIPREYRPSGEFMQTIPEALTSTFGVTARSYTNAGEIQKKANRFVSEQPGQKTQASFPASPYTDLRTFLRKDDLELAKKELKALEDSGTSFDKIYRAFKKASNSPFTMDNKLEPKFKATLNERELEQYKLAKQEKRDDLQQLLKLQGEIQAEKNK